MTFDFVQILKSKYYGISNKSVVGKTKDETAGEASKYLSD